MILLVMRKKGGGAWTMLMIRKRGTVLTTLSLIIITCTCTCMRKRRRVMGLMTFVYIIEDELHDIVHI